MEDARITFILSMMLALGFIAYIAIKVQAAYMIPPNMTETVTNIVKPLDPVKKWETVREERAQDLHEAYVQGISHAEYILKKCDCPNLHFDDALYKPNTQKKALAKWRYIECKKACKDANIAVTTQE